MLKKTFSVVECDEANSPSQKNPVFIYRLTEMMRKNLLKQCALMRRPVKSASGVCIKLKES